MDTSTPVVPAPREASTAPRHDVRHLARATWIAAVLAALAWVPFIDRAPGPDEGGYLLVASQWGHGHSLYGGFWVDRPPLLIFLHLIAATFGGAPALRLLGIAAVVISILLAAALARFATAGRVTSTLALIAPVVIAATFLTTPLFGTTQVDGELLSVPFVLAGVLAYVRGSSAATRTGALRWSIAAGAAATAAVLVKQNAIDVFVFAAAVCMLGIIAGDARRALRVVLVFATSSVLTLGLALGLAAARGTSPAGLWDAVVTFRFDAARVIHASATAANSERFSILLTSALTSLAPLVVALLALQLRRRPAPVAGPRPACVDLRWPALIVLGWEVVAIAAGSSFWLHYLLLLVPGMVLLAAAAAQRPASGRRILGIALVAAVASAGYSTATAATEEPRSSDTAVIAYLEANARPGDTAVIAFGHPNILWDTGLSSPYQQLWSLPVRVRDPDLTDFSRVLESEQAPTWVVVAGESLASWGIDATSADQVLADRYHLVAHEGRYTVWLRDAAIVPAVQH